MSSKEQESNNVKGKDVSRVGESFRHRKEYNNTARQNEYFIYSHEDNKIRYTNAVGENGKEINDELSSITNDKPDLKKKKSDIDTINKANSLTSVAETVAVATTTAVVLVVGGGIVIYSQGLDRPQIVEFTSVEPYENTINFALSIGNDQEQIDSGEPGEECDVVVELKCETYEDITPQTIPVSNYGMVKGTFEGLRYETTYSLNVFQNELLGLEKTYLLDTPIIVTIPPAETPEPPITNSFSFTKMILPNGTVSYEVAVTYVGETDYMSNFAIALYNSNIDPEAITEETEYIAIAYLDGLTGTQSLFWEGDFDEDTYLVALRALYYNDGSSPIHRANSDDSGTDTGSSEPGREYRILFTEVVDFTTIPSTEIPADNYVSLSRTVDPLGVYTYGVYVKCDYDLSEYSAFRLEFYSSDPAESDGRVTTFGIADLEVVNEFTYLDNFQPGFDDNDYWVSLIGIKYSDAGATSEEVTIFTDTGNGAEIPTSSVEKTNTLYVRRVSIFSQDDSEEFGVKYEGYLQVVTDAEYYSDYSFDVYSGADYIGASSIPGPDRLFEFELDYEDNHRGTLTFKIWANSTKPEDIAENPNESHPDYAEVEIFNVDIDLAEIPTRTEEVIHGISLDFYKSHHDGIKEVYLVFDAENALKGASNLRITITNETYADPVFEYNLPPIDDMRVLIEDSTAYDILDKDSGACTVTISHNVNNDWYTTYESDFPTWITSNYNTVNGSLFIEYEASEDLTSGGTYYFTVYSNENDDDYYRYPKFYVEVYEIIDEVPATQYTFMEREIVANTRTKCNSNFGGGKYLFKVYGTGGSYGSKLFTEEIINLDNL